PEDVLRKDDVFCKRSVTIHAQNTVVAADVCLTSATLKTDSAGEMGFRGDIIASLDQRHGGTDFHDFAAHFVPDNPRRMNTALGPGVPVIDVGVCAAERGCLYADHGLGRSRRRVRTGRCCQSWSCTSLDQRTHVTIVSQLTPLA